ncbi:MAG: hypothetical protein U5L08_12545 [Xanthomonadales bacterium]|nr:hypothetical protein [Xanthomonadales bacterium]
MACTPGSWFKFAYHYLSIRQIFLGKVPQREKLLAEIQVRDNPHKIPAKGTGRGVSKASSRCKIAVALHGDEQAPTA